MTTKAVGTRSFFQVKTYDSDKAELAGRGIAVVVHQGEEGSQLRVVLGTHDHLDNEMPDVYIERRPHGWAIYVAPNSNDPATVTYVLDNGKTFLTRDPDAAVLDMTPIEIDRELTKSQQEALDLARSVAGMWSVLPTTDGRLRVQDKMNVGARGAMAIRLARHAGVECDDDGYVP